LGAALPMPAATASHGALMVSGFLGTVISLERAVALGGRFALFAPLASGVGTLLMLFGFFAAGAALWLAAPILLFAIGVIIVRRQPAIHTVLLAVAALAWLAGNAAWFHGAPGLAPAWWFTFLVLTIAAERLEMTRLMKRRRAATPLFFAVTAATVAGALLAAFDAQAGAVVFGLALVALAGWLAVFDIARRTVRTEGFAQYAAVALLGGYAWLAVSGAAWIAAATVAPFLRDAALHALGLGFVVSMIFAHAPLVVPVIARRRMRFTPFFYVPLALLHASLVLRLLAGAYGGGPRLAGGILNAATLLVFAAAIAWSMQARAKIAA
jgi:hypothetical protein